MLGSKLHILSWIILIGELFVCSLANSESNENVTSSSKPTTPATTTTAPTTTTLANCQQPAQENFSRNHLSEKTCNITEGVTCEISCKDNYRIDKDKRSTTITCSDGKWHPKLPSCRKISCLRLVPKPHQIAMSSCTRVDTSCSVKCRRGYKFAGIKQEHEVRCELSGDLRSASLSPPAAPDCEKITCSSLSLTRYHNRTSCGSGDINSVCSARCRRGFRFESHTQVWTTTCTLNTVKRTTAEWKPSSPPQCQEIFCGRLVLKRHQIKSSYCTRVDTACSVKCDRGYKFAGTEQVHEVRCELSGDLRSASLNPSVAPDCERIKCLELNLGNGDGRYDKSSCRTADVGSTCQVSCRDGYTMSKYSRSWSTQCHLQTGTIAGEWSERKPKSCHEITCESVASIVTRGITSDGQCTTSIGTSCTFRCRTNYKFNGSWAESLSYAGLRMTCALSNDKLSGQWENNKRPLPGCEAVMCSPPRISRYHGYHYYSTRTSDRRVGSQCTVYCRPGYKFQTGSKEWRMTCLLQSAQVNADWSPRLPYCQKITCAKIAESGFGIPTNNDSEKQPIRNINCARGSTCDVTCPEGFVFSDDVKIKNLTCNTSTEKWNPIPSLVGLCKPKIKRIEKCLYWISATSADSNATAANQCKRVLGERATLAMPKQNRDRRTLASELTEYYIVGGYSENNKLFWNDGTSLKDSSKSTRHICLRLNKNGRLSATNCQSPSRFICETPKDNHNPCSMGTTCKSEGRCVPVGCSFRCLCPDLIFGPRCENGPFSINITKRSYHVSAGSTATFDIFISNHASGHKALFVLIVNGITTKNFTLQDGDENSDKVPVPNAQFDTFMSIQASLVKRPDVKQEHCDKIQVTGGIKLVNITTDLCNGTILHVLWKGFGNDTRYPIYYDVRIGGEKKGSAQAGEWCKVEGLKPGRQYNVKVIPRIKGCSNNDNLFPKHRVRTALGPPKASTVTIPKNLSNTSHKNCTVSWNLIRKNETRGYKVKIVEQVVNRVGLLKSTYTNISFVDVEQGLSTYKFITRPNSIYRVFVGTVPLNICTNAPIEWSSKKIGCKTGVSAPEAIDAPNRMLPQGAVSTIQVTQVNERNGVVSCYFIVIQKMNFQSNFSERITNLSRLQQNDSSLADWNIYIAIAMPRFESQISIPLGDGEISCCNIKILNESCHQNSTGRRKKRSVASEDIVHGENLPLEPGASYRHYILVSTPRYDGQDPYITASPFSEPWKVPNYETNEANHLNIVLPVIAIVIIGIALFLVYRRKSKSKRKHAYPRDDKENHSLSVEPRDFIDLAENPDSIVARKLAQFSLRVPDLFQAINNKRRNDDMQFLKEFKKHIPEAIQECDLSYEIAQLRVNQPKNRYKNIIPYDRSRVVLSNIPGVEFSDYVNASYMDGYSFPQKFIASQGPKPETVADFWRMIVEKNCHVIAMLTRLSEKLKVKCAQYWPEEQGESEEYDDMSVTLRETISYGDFVQRRLQISREDEVIDVDHFQFIAWPDHGIPTTTSSIMRFHKYVINSQPSTAGPIVVHCSAGVGRTGTFIALDYLANQIMETDDINIAEIIGKMRTKRPEMVQTLEQYIFIHKLALESYQFQDTDVDVSVFNATYNHMKRDSNSLVQEFAMLDYFSPLETSQENGTKEMNMHLNRNPSVITYDHNAVFLQMSPIDKNAPYYNASVIASYQQSNRFIAAQSPDQDSCDLFWRTVLDNNVNIIVALYGENEPYSYCYWPNESEKAEYGPVSVRTSSERVEDGCTERQFEVSIKMKKIQVLQIVYDMWPEHTAPVSSRVILDVIAKVEKQCQNLSNREQKTTLVHCSDGAGRTGTFCAISNLIERLKNENKVDVFRTAKDLRDQRPSMIQTKEQYEFCYRAISDFLQLFDLYGNFQ